MTNDGRDPCRSINRVLELAGRVNSRRILLFDTCIIFRSPFAESRKWFKGKETPPGG